MCQREHASICKIRREGENLCEMRVPVQFPISTSAGHISQKKGEPVHTNTRTRTQKNTLDKELLHKFSFIQFSLAHSCNGW